MVSNKVAMLKEYGRSEIVGRAELGAGQEGKST